MASVTLGFTSIEKKMPSYGNLFTCLLYAMLAFILRLSDQIIDPEFDLDYIAQPDNPIIKYFYQVKKKLNVGVGPLKNWPREAKKERNISKGGRQ